MVFFTFLHGERMVGTHVFVHFSNALTRVFLFFSHHFVSKMMINIRGNRLFNHC